MPPRLNKRQQRELEELEALKGGEKDISEDEELLETVDTQDRTPAFSAVSWMGIHLIQILFFLNTALHD